METFYTTFAILVLIFGLGLGISVGVTKAEKAECRKWQEYAVTLQDFYLVSWQFEQCQSYDINIGAPVK